MGKANEQRDSVGRTEYLKTDHSGVLMLLRDSTRKRQTLLVKERNTQTQKKRKKNQKISANNKRMNATSACVCRLAGCYRQKTSKLQKPNKIHFFPSSSFTPLLSKRFFFPLSTTSRFERGKKSESKKNPRTRKKEAVHSESNPFSSAKDEASVTNPLDAKKDSPLLMSFYVIYNPPFSSALRGLEQVPFPSYRTDTHTRGRR